MGLKPAWYYKGSASEYKEGVDPEVTCWHCKKTFLCDPTDATCRLCGAPYDYKRCEEFNFKPQINPPGTPHADGPYIWCIVNDYGTIMPIGNGKDLPYAKLCKRPGYVLYKLVRVEGVI